tara:strand:+ start:3501 stop:4229 length:729 start_codon:yes stop_codon:yes gene_type:complete
MKYLKLILIALLTLTPAHAGDYKPTKPIEKISKAMSSVERNVRSAAVKVIPPGGGHGSGSVIRYKDINIVITAQHVADKPIGTGYLISNDGRNLMATLVYSSKTHDIAVLYLNGEPDLIGITPMSWAPTSDYDIGTDIVYSGYPSHHKLMSFDGRIAGYEEEAGSGTQLIVNTYGWFGCSGSVIYNTKGKIIGVLYGVDVEYYPSIQINENMIWVAPIKAINIKEAIQPFCRGTVRNYRACR